MEGITNEIRNKIKCAVKAKLQEIGAYVDEELPDYIMVMIANRRSKSQMTSELSLFLGSHTDKFTDWLHVVLEKLEAFVVGSSSDKIKDTVPDTLKSGSDTFVLPVKSNNSIITAVHPTALLTSEKQPEVHSNTTNPVIVTNFEKDVYVPMPVSLIQPASSTNVHQSPEVDMEDDCLNIRDEVEQDFHGEDKGINNNSSSSAKYQGSMSEHKRRRHSRSYEDRFVKKVRREETSRSRPRRTDGRISSQVVSVVRPMLSQIVKPVERTRPNAEICEQEENSHKNGVNSIVRVTARRKLPAKMQATNSLILKAVADAQKSVTNQPPKVTEPELKSPPALFTRKYREKKLHAETVAITITNSSVTQLYDESLMDIDNHHTNRNLGHAEMESDEGIPTLTEVPEAMESQVELLFDDQPIETRFIVTLDGAHSLMSQRFEEELNDDEPGEMDDLTVSERKPVKSRLFRRRSTGTEVEVQQSLERCKFWPNCRQGDRCSFHHPKNPCKNFPTCVFGENCLFIHPPCKFGSTCTRKACPYTHSQRSKVIASVVAPVKFHSSNQQPPVVNGKTVCKFFPSCNNVNCSFFHPPACKYGANCTRVGCTFSHPTTTPSANKLKWVPK